MAALERAFAGSGSPSRTTASTSAPTPTASARSNITTHGLAILVNTRRLRVESHNVDSPHHITHHHVERFRDRKQARICAHIHVADPSGRRLHVFNTHISLPTPFARGFWTQPARMGWGANQLHEARTLAAFVERHAEGEPFVVCGDFNSAPGSPVFRYLTEEAGFRSAQQDLGLLDADDAKAWPTAGFMRMRMHLDHLFFGNGVRFLDLDGSAPLRRPEEPVRRALRPRAAHRPAALRRAPGLTCGLLSGHAASRTGRPGARGGPPRRARRALRDQEGLRAGALAAQGLLRGPGRGGRGAGRPALVGRPGRARGAQAEAGGGVRMRNRNLWTVAVAVLLAASGCKSFTAGGAGPAYVRDAMREYRFPKACEVLWVDALKVIAAHGFGLVGSDRELAGQEKQGVITNFLNRGHATTRDDDGVFEAESDANGQGLRFLVKGKPAGRGRLLRPVLRDPGRPGQLHRDPPPGLRQGAAAALADRPAGRGRGSSTTADKAK